MKVSIITPSFNQGAYIGQTVDSVLGQRYEDLEYVVVDGGSTDNTLAELRRECHKPTQLISERDKGQADAVNKGIRLSSGEIIGWLNADDCYFPGAVQAAVAEFRRRPEAVVVYGDYVKINDTGQVVALRRQPSFDAGVCLHAYLTVMQPAAFFRRSAFERIGGLDIHFHYVMDQDLWLKLSRVGEVVHISRYLAAFRLHPASKTVSNRRAFLPEYERIHLMHDPRPMTGTQRRLYHRYYLAKAVLKLVGSGAVLSRFGYDRCRQVREALVTRETFESLCRRMPK